MPTKEQYASHREYYLRYNREHRWKYRHLYPPAKDQKREQGRRYRGRRLLARIESRVAWIQEMSRLAHREWDEDLETRYAMVAMLVDGEGTISFKTTAPKTTPQYHHGTQRSFYIFPTVIVNNTDLRIPQFCRQTFGYGSLVRPKAKPGENICFRWHVDGKKVADVLSKIHPYLLIKRAQSNVIFEFLKSRLARAQKSPYSQEELSLLARMQVLNKRGRRMEDVLELQNRFT